MGKHVEQHKEIKFNISNFGPNVSCEDICEYLMCCSDEPCDTKLGYFRKTQSRRDFIIITIKAAPSKLATTLRTKKFRGELAEYSIISIKDIV